jgi:hypothetical protein
VERAGIGGQKPKRRIRRWGRIPERRAFHNYWRKMSGEKEIVALLMCPQKQSHAQTPLTMILQQQLPILLSLYWSSFVNLLHELVYELVLSHAKGHLLFKLQRKLDFSELEKRCAAYHHELGPGAPATHAVESLVRALLLKYLYDLSLRELETRLYTDL